MDTSLTITFIEEVAALTNAERARFGLAPLTLDSQLNQAAQSHSADMALNDFFGHTGSNGSTLTSRLLGSGYQFTTAADNVAAGYISPAEVVQGWMESPSHRINILDPNLKDIGVGYYHLPGDTGSTNYYYYWTQVFATRVPGTEPAPPAPSPSPEPDSEPEPAPSELVDNRESNPLPVEPENDSEPPAPEPPPVPEPVLDSPAPSPEPPAPEPVDFDNSSPEPSEPLPAEAGETDSNDNNIEPEPNPTIPDSDDEVMPPQVSAGGTDNSSESPATDAGEPPALADDNQVLIGDRFDNILQAGSGDDLIIGGLGNDQLFGGSGDDVLRGDLDSRDSGGTVGGDDLLFGGPGNDRLGGKGGNDQLFGGPGDDFLWGDDGDDLLRGGLGNDTLTGDDFSGGQGRDTFVLAIGEGTDTITDFEVGVDFIGLADGLTFDALTFSGNTIQAGEEILAVLNGVNTTLLTPASFITM